MRSMIGLSPRFLLCCLPFLSAICVSTTATPACAQDTQDKPASPQPFQIVSYVDGRAITLHQLEAFVERDLYELEYEKFLLLRRALDELVMRTVVERAAGEQNKTPQEFLSSLFPEEVKLTDDEVNRALDSSSTATTAEAMKSKIIADLEFQKKQKIYFERLKELRDRANVRILLHEPDSPRFIISADDDPSLGSDGAPVEIIEFGDYQCGHCAQANRTIQEILQLFGPAVRFVFRDFPSPHHPTAMKLALGANCAKAQGRFWQFHNAAFENQAKLTDEPAIIGLAEEVGLAASDFQDCLSKEIYRKEVLTDMEDARRAFIRETPTIYVNKRLVRDFSFESLQRAVAAALKQASGSSK